MIGLVAFAFWYVSMGYPLWNWTQAEQYDEEIVAYNANFDQVWKGVDESTLKAMGESIFNSKCVACHGITGEGQNGVAANLLEFGNEAHVIYVMKNGSKGGGYLTPAMPAQASTVAAMFGEENLDKHLADTAAYVISLSGRTPKSGDLNNGEQVYKAVCVACHGADGQGMGATGTIPNFAKNLTTYGTPEDIIRTLKNGKKGYIGEMPNFAAEGTMSALQYKAVATFVSKELNY
jgi:cytochrome c oxidase cbb3-type subunit 3